MCVIKQHESYHDFADKRKLFSINNFNDVFSNIAFILIGQYYTIFGNITELHKIYCLIVMGIMLTGYGSAYYHNNPTTETLFYDRLPMTLVMAGIISLELHDFYQLDYFYSVLIISIGTVFYWSRSKNLLPYCICQSLPIILYFLGKNSNYTHQEYYTFATILYVIAKFAELFDKQIYRYCPLSGHTIKHYTAAMSIMYILQMLNIRTRQQEAPF